jgi:hypothetical protein
MTERMKRVDDTTELRGAIAGHARAIAAGEIAAAEKFAHRDAIDAYREVAGEISRLVGPLVVEDLALAKIGAQYISKLRIVGAGAHRRVLYRWRREVDGKWVIAGVEDTTNKRSPWSDVPTLAAAAAQVRGEKRGENGNA